MNLDHPIKQWAWREYERTATKSQRKLLAKETCKSETWLNLHVDWSDVKCSDVTAWPLQNEELVGVPDANDDNNRFPQRAGGSHQANNGQMVSTAPFCAMRQNKADEHINYSTKTDKNTLSCYTTEDEHVCVPQTDLSTELEAPDEIFDTSVSHEMALTDTMGEICEEEVFCRMDSLIKVKVNHVTGSQEDDHEKKDLRQFQDKPNMCGYIYVTFTNIRANNSAVKMVANDITNII